MTKEEACEKIEQDIVSLRKSLRNSQVPKYLTHLGCMGETSYKEDYKRMNIQEDLLPSEIKEASISMKETTEE